jgi:hypothetical protein
MIKPQAGRPRSPGNQVGIPELYQQCLVAEQRSTKVNWAAVRMIFAKGWLTHRPLFEPPPTMDKSSPTRKATYLKIRRMGWQAAKYRCILDLVRGQRTREERLLVLASWLCQENVCEVQDIVDDQILQRLSKQTFGCFSNSDFRHADRVRSWLPYFERLLTDLRTYKTATAKLLKLGYAEAAVTAANGKRSAIPAACEWLVESRDAVSNVEALTLQNAYSRIYGPKRHSNAHTCQVSLQSKKRRLRRSSQNSRVQN